MDPVCHLAPGPVAAPALARVPLPVLSLVCRRVKDRMNLPVLFLVRYPVAGPVLLPVLARALILVQLPVFLPVLARAPACLPIETVTMKQTNDSCVRLRSLNTIMYVGTL
jgi:hypothetical protein